LEHYVLVGNRLHSVAVISALAVNCRCVDEYRGTGERLQGNREVMTRRSNEVMKVESEGEGTKMTQRR
jgi:hypothetical protein